MCFPNMQLSCFEFKLNYHRKIENIVLVRIIFPLPHSYSFPCIIHLWVSNVVKCFV